MGEPKGAGRSGGLLFLLIALFVGYLLVNAVAGVVKVVLGVLVLVVVAGLAVNIVRRR